MKKEKLHPYVSPALRQRPLMQEKSFLLSGEFGNSDTETFTEGEDFGW